MVTTVNFHKWVRLESHVKAQKQSYSRPEHLFEFKHLLDIIDLLLPRAIPAGLSVLPSHGGGEKTHRGGP